MLSQEIIQVTSTDLVDMNAKAASHPLRIDLVYADRHHSENIFGCSLYRPNARLWLHRLFAPIVLDAARLLHESYGARLILKDGLRPVEAQGLMHETAIVRANPQWMAGPSRMLSMPGQGGHPRGMAVDVAVESLKGGHIWDMGTVFDAMIPESARDYRGFPPDILNSRQRLETAFIEAAKAHDLPLLPLPSEWWDFRFPAAFSEKYAPVSDRDLPPDMRMTSQT